MSAPWDARGDLDDSRHVEMIGVARTMATPKSATSPDRSVLANSREVCYPNSIETLVVDPRSSSYRRDSNQLGGYVVAH
jgi:hypothetical protein